MKDGGKFLELQAENSKDWKKTKKETQKTKKGTQKTKNTKETEMTQDKTQNTNESQKTPPSKTSQESKQQTTGDNGLVVGFLSKFQEFGRDVRKFVVLESFVFLFIHMLKIVAIVLLISEQNMKCKGWADAYLNSHPLTFEIGNLTSYLTFAPMRLLQPNLRSNERVCICKTAAFLAEKLRLGNLSTFGIYNFSLGICEFVQSGE